MKTLVITLLSLLFVYPWQQSQTQQPDALFQSMYTFTGRFYSSDGSQSMDGVCYAVYVKIFENQLVVTQSRYNSPEYFDTTYPYVGKDKNGNRIYRKDKLDAYLVDGNYDIQRMMSYTTYNGNVTINTYYEVKKGDDSAKCYEDMKHKLYDTPMWP